MPPDIGQVVNTANPARVEVAKAVRTKDTRVCPECGKDIHSPECPYYSKKRR